MGVLNQICEDERIAVKFILSDQATDILKPDTALQLGGTKYLTRGLHSALATQGAKNDS